MRRPLSVLALSALALGSLTLPASAADFDAVPHIVRELAPGNANSGIHNSVVLGSRLVYTASNVTTGSEPWISDGTKAGTRMLRDILPGPSGSSAQDLTVFKGKVYFWASDGVHGYELWRTDGTTAGTTMVKDIALGSDDGIVFDGEFVATSDRLYFPGTTALDGTELWSTDGTTTQLMLDANPGPNGSNPRRLTRWDDKVLLQLDDGSHGTEPWSSGGTAATTTMVKDISPTGASNPGEFTPVSATKVVFRANPSPGVGQLWATDGTTAGTVAVDPATGSTNPLQLVRFGTRVIYTANAPGTTDSELWISDGTAAGSTLVKDINPLVGQASFIEHITVHNGRAYFAAAGADGDHELWSSDGTTAGTSLLKNISATGSSYPSNFLSAARVLYFSARSDTGGRELWQTTGTAAGTKQVKDINPGVADADATPLRGISNTLFFEAEDGTHGNELWAYTNRGSVTRGYPKSSYSRSAGSHKKIYLTVTVRATGTTPTGKVVLKQGSTIVGTGTLSGGKVSIHITKKFGKGKHYVRAYYSGSVRARISRSSLLTIKVR